MSHTSKLDSVVLGLIPDDMGNTRVLDAGIGGLWHNDKYRALRAIGHCSGCELYKYDLGD
jgi:hypothetical protein